MPNHLPQSLRATMDADYDSRLAFACCTSVFLFCASTIYIGAASCPRSWIPGNVVRLFLALTLPHLWWWLMTSCGRDRGMSSAVRSSNQRLAMHADGSFLYLLSTFVFTNWAIFFNLVPPMVSECLVLVQVVDMIVRCRDQIANEANLALGSLRRHLNLSSAAVLLAFIPFSLAVYWSLWFGLYHLALAIMHCTDQAANQANLVFILGFYAIVGSLLFLRASILFVYFDEDGSDGVAAAADDENDDDGSCGDDYDDDNDGGDSDDDDYDDDCDADGDDVDDCCDGVNDDDNSGDVGDDDDDNDGDGDKADDDVIDEDNKNGCKGVNDKEGDNDDDDYDNSPRPNHLPQRLPPTMDDDYHSLLAFVCCASVILFCALTIYVRTALCLRIWIPGNVVQLFLALNLPHLLLFLIFCGRDRGMSSAVRSSNLRLAIPADGSFLHLLFYAFVFTISAVFFYLAPHMVSACLVLILVVKMIVRCRDQIANEANLALGSLRRHLNSSSVDVLRVFIPFSLAVYWSLWFGLYHLALAIMHSTVQAANQANLVFILGFYAVVGSLLFFGASVLFLCFDEDGSDGVAAAADDENDDDGSGGDDYDDDDGGDSDDDDYDDDCDADGDDVDECCDGDNDDDNSCDVGEDDDYNDGDCDEANDEGDEDNENGCKGVNDKDDDDGDKADDDGDENNDNDCKGVNDKDDDGNDDKANDDGDENNENDCKGVNDKDDHNDYDHGDDDEADDHGEEDNENGCKGVNDKEDDDDEDDFVWVD